MSYDQYIHTDVVKILVLHEGYYSIIIIIFVLGVHIHSYMKMKVKSNIYMDH